MSVDGQGTKWLRNIAENFNRVGPTNVIDNRRTGGRQNSRSLIKPWAQALADISLLALCCHSNETRAPIENPPDSAQL